MFGNFGLVIGAAVLSIFGEPTPNDFPEESSILANLNDFMVEVMAVPTGMEFLNIMHGQIKAITPFAKEISPEFGANFAHLADDYLNYKNSPSASQAELLWKELKALTENVEILKSYDTNRAMQQCLKNFQTEITANLEEITNEALWQLVGQIEFINEFVIDLDESIRDEFETDFDFFSESFEAFLDEPSLDAQREVSINLERLIKALPQSKT